MIFAKKNPITRILLHRPGKPILLQMIDKISNYLLSKNCYTSLQAASLAKYIIHILIASY